MKKKLLFVSVLMVSLGATQTHAEMAASPNQVFDKPLEISDAMTVHKLKMLMKDKDKEIAGQAANRMVDVLVKNGYGIEAMIELDKYVTERDPLNFELRLKVAQAYRDAIEYDRALEHVKVLQKMRPHSAELALLLGSIQVEKGQFADAVKTLSTDANSLGVSSEMTLYKALALNGLKKYKDALENTRTILFLNKTEPLALLGSAEAYLGLGQKGDALKSLNLIVKNKELAPYLLVKAGKYFREAGDIRASKDFYARAYTLQPERASTAIELARDLSDLEEYASARKVLEETLQRQPDNDRVVFHLARVYSLTGEVDLAGKVVRTYWEKVPAQAWVASAYARALALADNKTQAIEVLKKTIGFAKEDYSEAILTLGQILASQERYKEALDVLHKGETAFPKEPTLKVELGKIYSAIGDNEKASYWVSASKKIESDKQRTPGSTASIDVLKEKVLR